MVGRVGVCGRGVGLGVWLVGNTGGWAMGEGAFLITRPPALTAQLPGEPQRARDTLHDDEI